MIYPASYPEDKFNRAEKQVYDALSGLDKNDYDIFFQKNFAGTVNNESADYEIDFLIIDKREERFNGILIIEVKGGELSFSSKHNCWFQNDKKMEQGPDDQAKRNKYNFLLRFRNILANVPVGWALCFPEGNNATGEFTPVNIRPWQIFDHSALISCKKSIELAFEEIRNQEKHRTGEPIETYNYKLSKSLLRGLGIVQPLNILLQQFEERFLTLGQEQKAFFESLYQVDKLAVSGGAGTGKTMLAACAANDFANEGKKVLLLCFNRMLCQALQKTNKSDNIKISTFHTYAYEYISQYTPGWFDSNEDKGSYFHESVFPDKLKEILDAHPKKEKYDILIIDEGQDFNGSWLTQAFRLVKQDGKIIIFFDINQNIFNRKFEIPYYGSFFPFKLKYNYRNTRKICDFVSARTGFEILPGSTPAGIDVEQIEYNTIQDLTDKLSFVTQDLLYNEKLKPDDMVILLDGSVAEHPLNKIEKLGNHQLKPWDVNSEREHNIIYFTSISRFKGLESNVILLVSDSNQDFYQNKRFYTQCTRAKSLLKIFTNTTHINIRVNP
jgi:hypothetical protein